MLRASNSSPNNPEGIFTRVHVGIDDVDAAIGGCTTHAAYLVVKEILRKFPNAKFIDYPNLVRLNPAIPFKTRGNGAVAFRVELHEKDLRNLIRVIEGVVKDYIDSLEFRPETEPGVAVVVGDPATDLRRLYLRALTDYVHTDYVKAVIDRLEERLYLPLGMGRGVIGALAAIGWPEGADCTYELLAYRHPRNYGRDRCVDPDSVKEMDEATKKETFMNYDPTRKRELITPSGPDPVLLGVRGESPHAVLRAFRMVKVCEPVSGWVIFRTNQGTDAHHVERAVEDFRPYQTGCVSGYVSSKPEVMRGGDVMIGISGREGTLVRAVAFRESGLARWFRLLMPGDRVRVCGVGRHWEGVGTVIHAEKLVIEELVRHTLMNPRCPRCGARMKSAGRSKGWKCVKCGFRATDLRKEIVPLGRGLREGTYVPPDKAIKHLMKPLCRYGRERPCGYVRPDGEWIA